MPAHLFEVASWSCRILAAVTALAVAFVCAAQDSAPRTVGVSDFKAGRFTDSKGGALAYRLFIPLDYDPQRKYPLVTFLHGRGRKGDDNRQQVNTPGALVWALPDKQLSNPCFVLAPQCPANDGWSRPEGMEGYPARTPVQILLELIDDLRKQYSIDDDRLYITGQSGGGGGTLTALQAQPTQFAAAILICPGGRNTPTQMKQLAKAFGRMPVWVFHGTDDQAIPVEQSRQLVKAFREAGGQPRYTEYPGVKHNAWNKAYHEPALHEWLFSHSLPR